MLTIIINGRQAVFEKELTLLELIEYYQKDQAVLVVEINGEIINKDKWSQQIIKENDQVELVTFVGGG